MDASDSTPCAGEKDDGAELLERQAVSMLCGHIDLVRHNLTIAERRADSLDERVESIRSARAQLQLAEAMLAEARGDWEGSS
jgi:hypothetical protein